MRYDRNEDGGQSPFVPPEAFPDIATCRVQMAELDGYLTCLSIWAWYCPHNLATGHISDCQHIDAFEIFARTNSAKSEPSAYTALEPTASTDLELVNFLQCGSSKAELVKNHAKNPGI